MEITDPEPTITNGSVIKDLRVAKHLILIKMKYFWFLVFSFLLMFSCGKKTVVVVPVPEPIPQKFAIETIVVSGNGKISSSATEVFAGVSITITWQPDFGYLLPKTIIVNGNVFETTNATFSYVVTKNTKVEVTFPSDPVVAVLSKRWESDSVYVGSVGYKSTSNVSLILYKDGTVLQKIGEEIVGGGYLYVWSYEGSTLKIAGLVYQFSVLNGRLRLVRPSSTEVFK